MSASSFHEYHSDTSRHPPDIPQTPLRHLQGTQDVNRRQNAPTDTSRHTQTAPVSVRGCLGVSVGICGRLLTSWFSWRCLGVSGGCLGGVYGYLSGIHGNLRCSDVFGGYLDSPSLQYAAVALLWHSPERHTFVHQTIPRHQNIKMSIYKVDKNHWVMWFFCIFCARQKNIKKHSCTWSPCI